MKNNSLHSSTINAGQNSVVQPNLQYLFFKFSISTIDQFFRHLRQYWTNLSSARPTATKFDKLNREIYYHISVKGNIRKMTFEEIELVWKMFTDIFEISKDPIDKKKSGAVLRVSDETSLFFKCRYDGSNFGLKVHLKSVKKFRDEHSEVLHYLFKLTSELAYAVINVLEFPIKKEEVVDLNKVHPPICGYPVCGQNLICEQSLEIHNSSSVRISKGDLQHFYLTRFIWYE